MKRFLFIVTVLLFISSCTSPIDYGSDYQSSADFTAYKSFSWHAGNDFNKASEAYIANEIVDKRIRVAIDSALEAKGFSKVNESSKADFQVNYSITTEDKVDIRTYNTYNGYGSVSLGAYGYRGPYGYYGLGYQHVQPVTETKVSQYKMGTLVIDIIDAKDNSLVWRGTAEGKMRKDQLTPEERDALIQEVVSNVLNGFPPKN